MQYPVLIFDWSGVISDDRPPVYEANMKLLDFHGLPRMTYPEWLENTQATPMAFLKKRGVAIDENDQATWKLYKAYFQESIKNDQKPTIYDGAKEFLATLKDHGYKLGILSAHPQENLEREAKRYEVFNFFHHIIGAAGTKIDGMHNHFTFFAEQPTNILFIGDTVSDMEVGKTTGTHTAAITTGYHSKKALAETKPDYLVDSLDELSKILLF